MIRAIRLTCLASLASSSLYEVRPKGEQVFNFDFVIWSKNPVIFKPPQNLELYINGELFDYAPEVEKLTVSSNSSSYGYALRSNQ
ncbi:hypothetical protein [Vibrio phage J14]|nr:hypothetical protein [Vibrio phage J14]